MTRGSVVLRILSFCIREWGVLLSDEGTVWIWRLSNYGFNFVYDGISLEIL